MSIGVVIADDHKIFVDGLRECLAKTPDISVLAVVNNGRQAIAAVEEFKPQVIIMDVSMPELNGILATRRIVASNPSTKVICLSMHSDRRFVLAALRAGAHGYLLKECELGELLAAVRSVAAGNTYLSPSIAGAVVDVVRGSKSASEVSFPEILTPREREVLQLLAEGLSTQEIADRLNVSSKTVASHREHIMHKLDVHSIAGLTKYAIRAGLTTADIRPGH